MLTSFLCPLHEILEILPFSLEGIEDSEAQLNSISNIHVHKTVTLAMTK